MKRSAIEECDVRILEERWTALWWAEQRTNRPDLAATNRAFAAYQRALKRRPKKSALDLLPPVRK